jgi:plastocyanin
LAGCFGGDDDDGGDFPVIPDPVEDPDPPMLGLAVDDPVGRLVLGGSADFNITITGDDANATWVGVRWAAESTADATNLTLDLFEGDEEATGPFTLPGTFTVQGWTPLTNQTYYLRAHAQVDHLGNTTDYWGDEFLVEVVPEVEVGDFAATHTVDILPIAILGSFDPEELEIDVGDSVTWTNTDPVAPHTATHDLWDTGDIDAGEDAGISVRFNAPGEYDYVCTLHADMAAKIIVS